VQTKHKDHLENAEARAEIFNLGERLRLSRTFVPGIAEADLERPTAGAIKRWLEKIIGDARSNGFGFIEYVVIHQGIIDRLKGDATDVIRFLRKQAYEGQCYSLIVCSGRGVPPQLFDEQFEGLRPRFVPISSLLEHVVRNPSKIHLSILLEASRGPNRR
jgi:hypothetical protein